MDPKQAPAETLATRVEETSGGVPLRERYGLVLLLILVGYVIGGSDPDAWVRTLTAILWIALLLATLWAPSVPGRLRSLGVIAVVLIFVTSISLGFATAEVAQGWRLILLAIAQLAAFMAIISQIISHDKVTIQTVMGGVAAYALIGFVSAAVFQGIDFLAGQTFLNGAVDPGDYTYFSFVTLTTVGYGDITAASELAKRLVVVEAFVGQVFIIVFVARLVSLWGKPGSSY